MIIEIHTNKNNEWGGLIMGLVLVAFSFLMMIQLGAAGLVIGFFVFWMGLGFTIMTYRMFSTKKPFIELHEEFFMLRTPVNTDMKEFIEHIINYSDIKSISNEGIFGKASDILTIKISGKNTDTIIEMRNTEITNEYVQLETNRLEIEKNKLLSMLEMKHINPDQELSTILSAIGFKPNEIPLYKRVTYFIISTLVTIYVGYGVFIGYLLIPTEEGFLVLYGFSLWIGSISFLCLAADFFIKIIDHYDKRDNEMTYWKYSNFAFRSGITLYAIALIVKIFS